MNLEKLKAYQLIERQELTDIHSTGWILKHIKTGARIMLIENDDENKVFNIAFRTTPKDSTGVAHITEHSVLCGSREFPLKDPFVELVKGSLNTFLNAMTYPDKTCYPVASCNDQDFQNLMHVYLDAVFYPNTYQREEIFRQEGWSYHLEDTNGPLTYNGVVYNEMKGAFSSADDVLERETMNRLFPDTTYGCESGGDPKNIPDLTYEAFLDFHRTYYHPSNSFIYLYGAMDFEEKLNFIDQHYLSAFDRKEVDSEVRLQTPFSSLCDVSVPYPISESEEEEDAAYLSYNAVIGTAADEKLCMAFEILDYALLSAPGAPLKKALQDAGIGKDVYGSFEDGILQPYFSIVAKGTNAQKKEEFVRIIRRVLEDICKNGIDQKAVLAGINYFEFRYREADFSSYPKGLMYSLDILGSWLYSDENPFAQVKQLALFDCLKKEAATGYFEGIIKTWLLDNTHACILTLTPSKGLQERRDRELAEKLEAYRASLPLEELEKMVKNTQDLIAYQEAEEDPEALKCIPLLRREDIKKEAAPLYNEELKIDDTLFLYHEICTNGIGYLDLLFKIPDLDTEEICCLGLLKAVLGMVDTENYSYGQLFNEINVSTGGITCGVEVHESCQDSSEFKVMFSVSAKALYSNMDQVFALTKEMLLTSRFDDGKRLYEIVNQTKSRLQSALIGAGHGTAVQHAASYGSKCALFQDKMAGILFYQFIEDLEKNFKIEKITAALEGLLGKIMRPENMVISYTGERESLEKVCSLAKELKENLYTEKTQPGTLSLNCSRQNEGFTTAGQVQYVALAGNFRRKGFDYSGALAILRVALGYDYLWNNIRVKGGAYGCMSGFKRNGESYFVTYRDPHLKRSLKVFRQIPDYLENFKADEREMTKYIIGTISNKDVPKTPQMKGSFSKSAYFCGVTQEMIQKERDEILNAGQEDMRALAPLIRAVLEDDQICVVGSESILKKDQDALYTVKPLIKG